MNAGSYVQGTRIALRRLCKEFDEGPATEVRIKSIQRRSSHATQDV